MPERLDAIAFHQRTKHSVASVQSGRHFLDWDNQPLPFKIYPALPAIPLPKPSDDGGARRAGLNLEALARLLFFTAGITRTKVFPNGLKHDFRAAACTGALYHIDLYAVCAALPDLEAGVYHFGPHDFALRGLRRGDFRRIVADASGNHPSLTSAPVALVCTSTFWRNAWKYQERAYRHCYWDAGTMLANLLSASVPEFPTTIVTGFADSLVNQLLDLDTDREVAVACVALGAGAVQPPPAPPETPLGYEVQPLSRHIVDYPAMRAVHLGTSLETPDDARQWHQRSFHRTLPAPTGKVTPLAAPTSAMPPIEKVIRRRGSARQFEQVPISFAALSEILRAANAEYGSDFSTNDPLPPTQTARLNDLYLIVNAVDGLAPGTYVFHPEIGGLEVLKEGAFRDVAGFLDLGQELAADASVNFYSLCDLALVMEQLGDRGYRAASLDAGIVGGRIYLAAYALGLAATGLTFFDDEVTKFFSPHAAGKGVMFLTAVGRTSRSIQRAG